MVKSTKCLRAFIGVCLILLQVSNSWCEDLSPSVVKIFSDENYLCGGTLVKDNFVVTTAECLLQPHDPENLTVVGNVVKSEATPADESSVTGIFPCPDFNEKTKTMDVAVLKLEKSIAGPKIKPAELCNKTSIVAGEPVVLYYWNLSKDVQRIKSVDFTLATLELIVIANDIEDQSYGESYSGSIFYAAKPERNYFFYDRGGPAAIDGQFCGIFHHGDKDLQRTVPGSLTSLADAQVKQFVIEALEY